MANHISLPLKFRTKGRFRYIYDSLRETHIAEVYTKDYAEFIVRAVNSHDELLEALRGLMLLITSIYDFVSLSPSDLKTIERARQALAKAEEE